MTPPISQWRALAASAAVSADADTRAALAHFQSWLSTLPTAGQLSAGARSELEQWAVTLSNIAQTAQNTSAHGLNALADSLAHFRDDMISPLRDLLGGLDNLVWGLLGLGALALGLGALVLMSGGGQVAIASIGIGYGAAIPIFAGGFGSALVLAMRAPVLVAGGFGAALARLPAVLPGLLPAFL